MNKTIKKYLNVVLSKIISTTNNIKTKLNGRLINGTMYYGVPDWIEDTPKNEMAIKLKRKGLAVNFEDAQEQAETILKINKGIPKTKSDAYDNYTIPGGYNWNNAHIVGHLKADFWD